MNKFYVFLLCASFTGLNVNGSSVEAGTQTDSTTQTPTDLATIQKKLRSAKIVRDAVGFYLKHIKTDIDQCCPFNQRRLEKLISHVEIEAAVQSRTADELKAILFNAKRAQLERAAHQRQAEADHQKNLAKQQFKAEQEAIIERILQQIKEKNEIKK